MERMLTHWLTPITFSPCSRLVSYWVRLSSFSILLVSIRHGLLANLIAQSHLTRLRVGPDSTTTIPATASTDLWSLSQDGDFLHYKGLLYVPDNQDIHWTSFAPTTTIAWLDILASPRRSRTSVVSSIGPEWSPSLLTTSTHVQSAVAESPSTTSHLALIDSSQSVNDPGTLSRWISSRGCPCLRDRTRFWW